jgi:hypothetical protein
MSVDEPAFVRSTEDLVRRIRSDRSGWSHAWFRGEPKVECSQSLLPKLYRPISGRGPHHENKLLQHFRLRAPTFSYPLCPGREETDKWLFLAQHVGLPTRLLDWTEGALVALHFALQCKNPVVWMLNPIELNNCSCSAGSKSDQFPLTWIENNLGSVNINGAWEEDRKGVALPVAIFPTSTHPRVSVQRSCFTVHGKEKSSLAVLVPEQLRCYVIDPAARTQMMEDLRLLGISHSTLFPDLDGLAKDLSDVY